jgi:SAM-dependent methyltransferase
VTVNAPDAARLLPAILRPGSLLRQVEEGLYSCLPIADEGASYDTKAFIYDLLVGARLYNRIAWGTSPRHYEAFARRALASAPEGWVFELAAGSCLASARAYAETSRPALVIDRSLGMLRRARRRVARAAGGRLPPNVVFLQGDVFALPFIPGQGTTVLALGALHVFEDAAGFLRALDHHRRPGGSLFLTSLVSGRWLSSRLLAKMHALREVAPPRSFAEVTALAAQALQRRLAARVRGAMAYLDG